MLLCWLLAMGGCAWDAYTTNCAIRLGLRERTASWILGPSPSPITSYLFNLAQPFVLLVLHTPWWAYLALGLLHSGAAALNTLAIEQAESDIDMGIRDDAPNWADIVGLADQGFEAAASAFIDLRMQIEKLEALKKDIGAELEAMLTVASQKRVKFGNFAIERAAGRSASKISAQLLAGLGVSAEVISAATIPGSPTSYVQAIDLTKKPTPKEVTANVAPVE